MPPGKHLALIWMLATGAAAFAQETPRVWIFNGTPGDDEHHVFYEKNIARLRTTFINRFGIPAQNLTVLYGPKDAGYDGPCTRETLLAELAKVAAHTKEPNAAPVWLVFQGHANPIPGGANFNLPGPDASARDIGEALRTAAPKASIVVLATTACSAAFVRPLSGPGRLIIAASTPADPENETEFPEALANALQAPATDANHDGTVSVTELFLACHGQVQRIYESQGFMIKEHAQLDGNGDGRATQRPSPADAEPAALVGLRIIKEQNKFD
ncbi:MAG: hypothetical protein JWL90_2566 [Chthoniobacteraceae bacterium]|nr:hypothetical protein [Chthoniobacteraceae bacterium]